MSIDGIRTRTVRVESQDADHYTTPYYIQNLRRYGAVRFFTFVYLNAPGLILQVLVRSRAGMIVSHLANDFFHFCTRCNPGKDKCLSRIPFRKNQFNFFQTKIPSPFAAQQKVEKSQVRIPVYIIFFTFGSRIHSNKYSKNSLLNDSGVVIYYIRLAPGYIT